MKVTVRYFASIREAIGQGSEAIETSAATLALLRDELIARGGAHASSLAHRSPTNVRVPGFFSGERRKKHATVLALSTDKSSSLSHQETGGRTRGSGVQ
jgi:molybdopterin synthase sulfur carrier subunit